MMQWIGNKQWPLKLDTVYQKELNAAQDKKWTLLHAGNPDPVGEVYVDSLLAKKITLTCSLLAGVPPVLERATLPTCECTRVDTWFHTVSSKPTCHRLALSNHRRRST